jgi:hypothetical protein
VLSEDDQLETWWESLPDDRRVAVLDADLDDIPGWIVASFVATCAGIAGDPSTDESVDVKTRAPVILREFIARRRAGGDTDHDRTGSAG